MINLRRYQDEGVGKIRSAFKNGIKKILFVLPTGGGKTVVFTYITQKMSIRKKRVLILVHRIELLRQTSKALQKFDVDHGMINPMYTPNFAIDGQVASVQTIIKRLPYTVAVGWIPDLIIVDEAHHATAGSWRKIIDHFEQLNENMRVIGVTATPIRTDGQGLGVDHGGMFEELICGPSMRWLMDEGFLVTAKVLSPPKKFDQSKLKRGRGDYNTKDLEVLINKPTITGDAVAHYKETCEGVPTIVFCTTVRHTEEVAQEFRNHGYRFYAIDGTTDDDTRNRVLSGLADGSVDGVCSCDLINEGTDVPAATCAMLLRPTSSLSLHLQQLGRVLRPVFPDGFNASEATKEERLAAIAASEKPYAYILDHVGNVGAWIDGEFVVNHGLPDQEHNWSLDGEVKKRGKKKTEKGVRVQMCLSCFACHEPAPVCPQCGHVYEIKDSTPKQVAGQLQEITSDMVVKKEKRIETGKADTLEELLKIAAERGYKENWAHIQFSLKDKKKQERLERLQKKIDVQKSQEIPFEEITADEFSENLDF